MNVTSYEIKQGGGHFRPFFLIGVPTFGLVSIEFSCSLLNVQAPVNCERQMYCPKGMEVAVARNAIVERALAYEKGKRPHYILMVDDDVLAPWNALLMLQETLEKRSLDVVSALYYLKQDPPAPMMWRHARMGWMIKGKEWNSGDLVRVDGTGCGFTLFRTSVFERIEGPWFKTGQGIDEDTGEFAVHTEDTYFYGKARKAGIQVYVDTRVRCSHMDAKSGRHY